MMRVWRGLPLRASLLVAVLTILVFGGSAMAQTEAAAVEPVKIGDVKDISAGDTAWMLTSSALVLMMTGPGLALFYSGLVRRKNVLATMMQSFILMAVVTRGLGHRRLQPGVRHRQSVHRRVPLRVPARTSALPRAEYAATIPHTTWMVYQLMFAIITPALICGAYAERMKFSAMLLFSIAVAAGDLLPAGPHGLGQGRAVQRLHGRHAFRRWTSPAARWCTSARASRR